MSTLEHVIDPHAQDELKRIRRQLRVAEALGSGGTAVLQFGAFNLFIYRQLTEPPHPTGTDMALWLKTSLPQIWSISTLKGTGVPQWVPFAEARSS